MHTDQRDAPHATGRAADEWPFADELVSLMHTMLGVIGRCHDALLQEESETLYVLRGTLAQLCGPELPAATSGAPWASLHGELGRLLDRVLESPHEARPQRSILGAAPSAALATLSASHQHHAHLDNLAQWFHALATLLDESHPRALDMLRLRFSGLGSREIAERMNLPFRLVERVLSDTRQRAVLVSGRRELVP